MHKIINKKSIQKITAIIIIMIMCNFIMSTKAWAETTKWMSINDYLKLNIGATDIKQDVYDANTSPAVKKICDAWNISDPEEAIEILKNHADDKNTLKIVTETGDTVVYKIDKVSIQPTEKEKSKYNIPTDGNGYANVDTTANGTGTTNGYREGAKEGEEFGLLFGPLSFLIKGIGDTANKILQFYIIGDGSAVFYTKSFWGDKVTEVVKKNPVIPEDKEDKEDKVETIEVVQEYIDTATGKYGIPDIKLTPAEIFAGNVSALDANFFETKTDHNSELGGNSKSIIEILKGTVSKWYVALRNIAIVGLLSVLLYIGIRIVISSNAGDKAKYKQFFVDWVVALCLIFFLHYIMAFTMTMSETITDVLAGDNTSQGRIKQVNIRLINENGTTFTDGVAIEFSSNFTGVARIKAEYENTMLKMGYSVLYLGLTIYTAYFTFVYLKRLLMLAFFTMIAPLVALSYPLDKIKDGKAQAFNYWFKEYMFYALLQPLHMLLYTVFVSSALSVAANNLLYAIVALAFIVPAEKIVKQMFGIKGNTEDKIGGFAGGALASQAFNMLTKGKSQPKKGGGDAPKGEKGMRMKNPNTPDALDTLAGDAMENGTGSAAGAGFAAGAASANATRNESNEAASGNGISVGEDGIIDGVQARELLDNEQQGNGTENSEMQSGENTAMPENGQQNSNADDTNINSDNQNEDPFAAARREANTSLIDRTNTALNMRWQRAGGWKGLAKTGARVAGRIYATGAMGALGLGLGIVGGDMNDTLKGLGAGLTAGYAAGGRLNSAVANTIAGNNAVGSFVGDVFKGTGPERQRNDYIKSYMSNQENRNRLIDKNPNISGPELDAELRQRAELSYDSGVSDAKMLDRAVKMKKKLDSQNPNGAGNTENHGSNYDKTIATMQLANKYSDATFEDDDKIAKAQRRLATKLERNMTERTNGPINAETARQMKSKANAEAAETMNNIDYLKNG